MAVKHVTLNIIKQMYEDCMHACKHACCRYMSYILVVKL